MTHNQEDDEMPKAYQKAQNQLDNLLEKFKNGEIEKEASKAFINPKEGDSRPIFEWSFRNRLMVMIQGSTDARGYNQWQEVGRQVKKGSESIRILAPKTYTKTVEKENKEELEELREARWATEKEETEKKVKFEIMNGFRAVPVFRYEDTEPIEDFEGEVYRKEDLDYQPEDLPALLPLAEKLGVSVSYEPAQVKRAYGSYKPDRDQIELKTSDKQTFYHELAHAVEKEIKGDLKNGQDPLQEASAELSASILSRIYEGEASEEYTFKYLESYSKQDMGSEDAYDLALKVLGRVDKILRYVIEKAENMDLQEQEAVITA